ncbi:unnamed protein product, partial [marine sediment metagenome]
MPKGNRLSNIEIDEVSFVDRPADPNAKVSFFKRDSEEDIEKKLKLAGGSGPREFTVEMREALATRGKALGDGSFPIPDKDALRRAVLSFGRAGPGKQAQVRAHIIRRAKALGAMTMLPAEWQITKEESAMSKKGFLHGLATRLGLNVDDETSLDDLDTAIGMMTDTAYEDVAKAIVAGKESDSYDDDDS